MPGCRVFLPSMKDGVANKSVGSEGCESPYHQLPGLDGQHSRCTGQVTVMCAARKVSAALPSRPRGRYWTFRHHHHWRDRIVLPGLPQRVPMARGDGPALPPAAWVSDGLRGSAFVTMLSGKVALIRLRHHADANRGFLIGELALPPGPLWPDRRR